MSHKEEIQNKSDVSLHIAVIADTHGKLPESVIPMLCKADEIWHLGDYCNLAILNAVSTLGPRFYGVLGNNDYGLNLPPQLSLVRGGHTFLLIHIPPLLPSQADILLHGHTHVPRDEKIESTRILNPGTLGKPNKGSPASWAWLTITPTKINWTIMPVNK